MQELKVMWLLPHSFTPGLSRAVAVVLLHCIELGQWEVSACAATATSWSKCYINWVTAGLAPRGSNGTSVGTSTSRAQQV